MTSLQTVRRVPLSVRIASAASPILIQAICPLGRLSRPVAVRSFVPSRNPCFWRQAFAPHFSIGSWRSAVEDQTTTGVVCGSALFRGRFVRLLEFVLRASRAIAGAMLRSAKTCSVMETTDEFTILIGLTSDRFVAWPVVSWIDTNRITRIAAPIAWLRSANDVDLT